MILGNSLPCSDPVSSSVKWGRSHHEPSGFREDRGEGGVPATLALGAASV